MLNFRIEKIVAFISQAGIDLEKAGREFFGNYEIYPGMPDFEQTSSLFNEWLAKDHFADLNKDILTIGLPEQMIVDDLKFFQDIWNFFPHKALDGKCPGEKYKEIYGQ